MDLAIVNISAFGGWNSFLSKGIYFVAAASDSEDTALKDSTGSSYQCAMTSPQTTTVARSRIDCARQCKTSQDCIGFNFLQQTRTCQQFTAVPSYFNTQIGCSYYMVN